MEENICTMMVKFTNAHPDHLGNALYINYLDIVAVYEYASQKGGSLGTQILGTTGTIWTVEESIDEVIKMLNPPDLLLE